MTIRPLEQFPPPVAPEAFEQPDGLYVAYTNISPSLPTTVEDAVQILYGDQSRFAEWQRERLQWTVRELNTMRTSSSEEFAAKASQLLENLAVQKAAFSTGPYYEGVGKWRLVEDLQAMGTPLVLPQYREQNQKLRGLFLSLMPLFVCKNRERTEAEGYFFGDKFSRYSIRRFTQGLCPLLWEIYQGYQGLYVKGNSQERSCVDIVRTMIDIVEKVSGAVLKLPGLEGEQHHALANGTSKLQFLVGSIENQVEGKWIPITQHITWIKQKEIGPITDAATEYFKKYGFVTYLHTSPIEFDKLKSSVWHVMQRLIQGHPKATPGTRTKFFKQDLAVMDYRLYHAMLWERGSAWMTGTLREAVCLAQEEPVPTTTDGDALSQPFLIQYVNDPKRYALKQQGGGQEATTIEASREEKK